MSPLAGSRDDVAAGRCLCGVDSGLLGEPDEALDVLFFGEAAGRAVLDALVAFALLVSGKSDSRQSNSQFVRVKSCDCAPLLEFAERAAPGVLCFVVLAAVLVEAGVSLVRALEEEIREGVLGKQGPLPVVHGWVLIDGHDLAPCAADSLHRETMSVDDTIGGTGTLDVVGT